MSTLLQIGIKQINCLAVVLLMLWLSGFGCAFCCSTGLGNHCCSSQQNSCATEVEADCCKPEKQHRASTDGDAISSLPDAGCPLLPSQAPSEFNQSKVTNLFAATLPVTPIISQLEMDKYAPVFTHALLSANRGSTYLRCCVFLI
jgi:hypothetical protein